MAKTAIPKEIQKGLKALAEVKKVPVETLIKRMKELKETDNHILAMSDDEETNEFKIRVAWALLYDEYASSGKSEDFIIKPLLTPRIREVPQKGVPTLVGELSAIGQRIVDGEKEDPVYLAGSFWRESAKKLEDMKKGQVYRVSLSAKKNPWGYKVSAQSLNFSPSNEKMISLKDFYEKEIEGSGREITIGEVDLNKSEDDTDIRVLEVTVVNAEVGESANGEYGWYDVMDDSIMGNTHRIWSHPKDVEWEKSSKLKMAVHVFESKDECKTNIRFILPTDAAMKREYEIVPVVDEQDTVDVTESNSDDNSDDDSDDVDYEI